MQERPLNTDDLAGAQSADQSIDQPIESTPRDGEPGLTDRSATDRPDLTVVPGGQQTTGEGAVQKGEHTLLPAEQSGDFRRRWQEIQAGFVDEPRQAVEQADTLVADLLQRLASGFSDERKRLEGQWDRGGDVSTEDLRVALTRYRSFFDRLLAA
jgi:hypothetical protein